MSIRDDLKRARTLSVRGRLCCSTSTLVLGLVLLAITPAALAQSVTGTGNISPGLPAPPNWIVPGWVLGVGVAGMGTLTIAAGGTVSTDGGSSYIGQNRGGDGTVTVTGAGSTLANNALYVGYEGTGTLIIADGGTVTNSYGTIGWQVGSTGTVTVTGAGSTWTNSDDLSVGDGGAGTLTIENGGKVSGTRGIVGRVGTGTATVTGPGSTWTNSGLLSVGGSGTGTLIIANGGTVTNSDGNIGSRGTVTVTGTGSTWSNSGILNIDGSGGRLIVEHGGSVASRGGHVSTGTATVTGAGSTWANNAELYVGYFGTGTLTIENGGKVWSTVGVVGHNGGFVGVSGTGTVTVTGAGSTWTNSDELHVGESDTGTLTIASGGAVSNTSGYIAYAAGSTGTVTVTGAGSTWTNSGGLSVGSSGTGRLTIENGGNVTSGGGRVGGSGTSTGTVTVTGAGSTWTNSGELTIGYFGAGTLTIENGGKVSNTRGGVGHGGGSTGTVTVTGAGSTWTNSGILTVGDAGTSTLTIASGGKVSSSHGFLGYGGGSNGTVIVTGAGSTWINSGDLSLGSGGTGALTIENGGKVSNTSGTIYAGTVKVTGAGSTWTNSGPLAVGLSSTATLTIEKGGTVSATTTALFGAASLNLLGDATNGRGVLETGQLQKSAGSATFNLNGGILRATNNEADYLQGFTTQTIGANGVVFDSNGYDIGVQASLDGAGGLTKQGAGTLTLTGTNSYTGGTTISGGKLQVSSDANLGNASGGLTLAGGTLQVTASFSSARTVTLSGGGGTIEVASSQLLLQTGTISGSGGLTKTGGGVLYLSGTSTYSGATTVSAGMLYIDGAGAMSAASDYTVSIGAALAMSGSLGTVTAGSIAGAGQIRIGLGSTLEAGATNASTTFSGMIYDAGSIRKVGTGTLILTQENTYSGGTTIAGGAISISRESNLGATSGALTLDGGVLQVTGTTLHELTRNIVFGNKGGGFDIVEAGNTFTVNQSFSGTGSFSKAGAGTLVLKNTQSYSGTTNVTGGTLRAGQAGAFSQNSAFTVASGATLDFAGFNQTIASFAGAGTIMLGSGNLTAGSDNSSTSFSGSITGTGGVTKTGTGTLTLTGTNTYTGSTKLSSGKLVVNGSLASSVTLDGGTLGGSGTVGEVSVGSGATVAPGNSIGTLTVSGNVSFASGSTYQVEVNAAGQSDRIVASGSATISGGTVEVLAASGNYAASTNYTIITAAGGVTGQFSTVTSNLAFLTPSLSYGGTSVTLTMTRNDNSFGPDGGSTASNYIAMTRNQGFIANAAERLGVGNAVYDTLLSGTAAEARAGFDLLSGEAHAQAVSVMIEESRLVRDTILGRLRGPLLTQPGQQVAASFSADLPGRKNAITMAAPVPQPRYAFWGEAFGGTGNTDADGNAAGQSRRTGGALLGADLMLFEAPGSSLKVGVAGGYSQSRFDLDARLSSGKLESGHAALYAGARFGSLRFDAGAAYSWSESDIRRQVQIRGFGDLLRLQRPGSVMQGFAELGYGFAFQGFALEPFAQLAVIRVSTDAGTERGGVAALRVLSSEQTLGFTTLGVRAEAQIGTMPLFARAMLGWRHGFGELTPQARTAFATGTTPSVVFAAPIDREALVAEAGLDWRLSQATALGLTYSAAIGERSRDHALKGRVEMRF